MFITRVFAILSRLGLGVVLCWSAVPKLVYPDRFFGNVLEYGVIGPEAASYVAAVLPWLELMLGLLLLSNILVSGAFLVSLMLLLGFSGLQAYALATGLEVSCGCFAVADEAGAVSGWTVTRAALLGVLAAVGLVCIHLVRVDGVDLIDEKRSVPSTAGADSSTTPQPVVDS